MNMKCENIEKWNGIWNVNMENMKWLWIWNECECKALWKYENVMYEMECNEYACKNMKWDGIETFVNARHWEIWTVWNGM